MEVLKEIDNLGSKLLPVKIFRTILPGQCCSINPHWHEYMEILYFYEGSALVRINKEYINVAKGNIIILNGFDIHSVKGNTEYLVLQFQPNETTEIGFDFKKALPVSDRNKVLTQSGRNRHIAMIEDHLQEIAGVYEEKLPGFELSVRGSILKIISAIFAYAKEMGYDISEYCKQKENLERLDLLFKYIDEHYNESMNINDAAKLLNFSPNYFCRFFKKVMGKTFLEYLNMYRCTRAEVLINTTDRSITDIAMSSGFSSINYFNRIYKKFKGINPSTERRNKDNIVQQ